MNRIKIIDVPHYETDPKVIVKQLSKFLEDFRKKKVAIDLIGDDERSAEFNVSDIEIFGEELSDGVELTYLADHSAREQACQRPCRSGRRFASQTRGVRSAGALSCWYASHHGQGSELGG